MIPMNDAVQLYKSGKTDKWGIVTPSTEPVHLKGMVTYTTDLKEVAGVNGEKVAVTANITFKGNVDIKVKDEIVFDSAFRLTVVQVQFVRDLAGKTLFTKVVV